MKIALGSDHGGFEVKEVIRKSLAKRAIEVEDVGCYDNKSVDYPDYAHRVAFLVSSNAVEQGILVCTTGIGMSIVANKFPRVRAALCFSAKMAMMARTHNNANILILGGSLISREDAEAILDAWLKNSFSHDERHERRIRKIERYSLLTGVEEEDEEIYTTFQDEIRRQQATIDLIASENYASRAVREAQSSVMMNKYAEGYPGERWYRGCEHVDAAERLAISRAKEIFGAEHVNVQPHCGSSANMAVYFAVLKPGDTILSMNLAHGGHLSHGHKSSFSGRFYKIVSYGVDRKTERINYDNVAELARKTKPKLIIAGASAYPRILDFERFREIADSVGACLMVDMAHIAGLVAGGSHPNPVPYSEFVTGTTHKTLRGPRGGIILCRKEYAADIDKQVFPGIQGGPLMHTIAAKALCFHYILEPSFKVYTQQIVRNAKVMADALQAEGLRLVSGGTDNHLMLVDVSAMGLTGREAATALEKAGIIVNKNSIPCDKNSSLVTSGIRIGTPAVTTRGMKEPEMETIAAMIVDVLRNINDRTVLKKTRKKAGELASRFPVL